MTPGMPTPGHPRRVPRVLIPFDIDEAMTVAEAAKVAGCTKVTVRNWAAEFDLGRRIGGRWFISRVALAMYLENDLRGLEAYLAGDRDSQTVLAYFERLGITFLEKNSTEKVEEAKTAKADMALVEERVQTLAHVRSDI